MNVDLVLRESTRALTTTLPNSVTWQFGIFSVSSRSRSAVGFHSTDAALTPYTTTAPPLSALLRVAPLRAHPLDARRKPSGVAGSAQCTPAQRNNPGQQHGCAGAAARGMRFTAI